MVGPNWKITVWKYNTIKSYFCHVRDTRFSIVKFGGQQLRIGSSGGSGHLINDFILFEVKYGATVAAGDLDGDGISEIIAGAGPDPQNKAWVRIFKGNGTPVGNGFLAYPEEIKYGVRPSGINLVR